MTSCSTGSNAVIPRWRGDLHIPSGAGLETKGKERKERWFPTHEVGTQRARRLGDGEERSFVLQEQSGREGNGVEAILPSTALRAGRMTAAVSAPEGSLQLSREKAPKKRPDNRYANTTYDHCYQFISHIGFSDLLSDGDTACRGRYRVAIKINASACVKHSLRHAFAALCWRLSAD
jgi:hypothetical protein